MNNLIVETESAGSFADVDEEQLERLVAAISPDNSYLILHRPDLGDDVFAQAALERNPRGQIVPGHYVVEHRAGPHRHYQAQTKGLGQVSEVLSGWAMDRADWDATVEWKILDLGF